MVTERDDILQIHWDFKMSPAKYAQQGRDYSVLLRVLVLTGS